MTRGKAANIAIGRYAWIVIGVAKQKIGDESLVQFAGNGTMREHRLQCIAKNQGAILLRIKKGPRPGQVAVTDKFARSGIPQDETQVAVEVWKSSFSAFGKVLQH